MADQGRELMPKIVKKTMEMDQDYIDRLRVIFGVRTEKEAVNKAMEMALIDDEIVKAHKRMKGEGDILEEVFR
jgi:CHASE3 domain sensor protein